jgi:predicted Zn finger-like uncharacterized protein
MDVMCEKCGVEYEFDDNRVTNNGVSVKCSSCGHLFRIYKKSVAPVQAAPDDTKVDNGKGRFWMVRKPDGTVLVFKELAMLQKWIGEGTILRDDEISRAGENWKRLADLAELASFFQSFDQNQPSRTQPSRTQPSRTQPSRTQPLQSAVPIQSYPPGISSFQTSSPSSPVLPRGGGLSSTPPPVTSQPTSPPVAQAQGYPVKFSGSLTPPALGVGIPAGQAVVSRPQAWSEAPLPTITPIHSDRNEPDSWGDLDNNEVEDDVVEKWKRRGRRKWFFIGPLALIVVGAAVGYMLVPAEFKKLAGKAIGIDMEGISAAAQAHYKSGYEYFLKDTTNDWEVALLEFDKAAQEMKGKYPAAHAASAQVYVTRAERLTERSSILGEQIAMLETQIKAITPSGKQPEGGEAKAKFTNFQNQKAALQDERSGLEMAIPQDLDQAKRQTEAARTLDPGAFESKLAYADYLRISGGRAKVETVLNEATGIQPDNPELFYVEGASLAVQPGALESAAEKLTQAIELQQKAGKPDLIRARYRLAATLLALKHPDEARAQLERILQEVPEHLDAKRLLEKLASQSTEIKTGEKKNNVKDETKTEARVNNKSGDLVKLTEPAKPSEPVKPNEPAKPTTYDGWMSQADRLQRAKRVREALAAYDAALNLKDEDVEALTGKGQCLMAMGTYPAAMALFERALKIHPRFGDALIGLAEANKHQGNKNEALVYYQKYIDLMPDGPDAAQARENINELKEAH